ncbi:MAG: undecaprenyl-phosphate glucose phosphotransferase [Candidatus Omnitrophota bacterium]
MLKKHGQVLLSLFFTVDILWIISCWMLTYALRFSTHIFPVFSDIPDLKQHASLLFLIIPVYAFVFKAAGIYKPRRTSQISAEILDIIKASVIALMSLIFIIYFFKRGFHYSRLTLILFCLINISGLILLRSLLRKIIRNLRKEGYNLRHVLIVGTGPHAREVYDRIHEHLEFGLNCAGFLTKDSVNCRSAVHHSKIIGTYRDIEIIIREKGIDQVIFAMPSGEERIIRALLKRIEKEGVDIKVILDLGGFFTLRKSFEDLAGLPVITLRESPLFGWSRVGKRLVDIIGSTFSIIVSAPLMCCVALLIKLTSDGPLLYKQERIGLDGEKFVIYKFRSMEDNAERSSGPVWTAQFDNRRTPLGAFIRRTGIDELPQLFNILWGQMSLVGPRPERPVFVEQFRKHLPNYMLRHKIKAGVTGWAQVHGWRGDTSLEERIKYDLFYIEHWSLFLDLKIICMTLPAIIKGKGAY